MELKLVPVTKDNWRQAAFLTTNPERKICLDEQWIACNAFSLLQSHFDSDWDCRLMMDGEKAVGFLFYGYWRERDRYLLCRYMIDVKYQGKGYGAAFLPISVELIRSQYGCEDVYLTVSDDNARAISLYKKAGFVPTEEMDEDERVYVLKERK